MESNKQLLLQKGSRRMDGDRQRNEREGSKVFGRTIFPNESKYPLDLASARQSKAKAVVYQDGKHSEILYHDGPNMALPAHVSMVLGDGDTLTIKHITASRVRANLARVHQVNLQPGKYCAFMVDYPASQAYNAGLATSLKSGSVGGMQQLHDITGLDAVLYGSRPTAPAQQPSEPHRMGASFLNGCDSAVLACIFQVPDQEAQPIRTAYQDAILSDMFVDMRRHDGPQEHKVSMTGLTLIETDRQAISPGYSSFRRTRKTQDLDATVLDIKLATLADLVWSAVTQRMPLLKRYRTTFITDDGLPFVLGSSAANLISLTRNQSVKMHIDTNDGGWTIIVWFHSGTGSVTGGEFALPSFGVSFIPLDFTVVVFRGAVVVHGTLALSATPGVTRYGSSHFTRVHDLNNLARLGKHFSAETGKPPFDALIQKQRELANAPAESAFEVRKTVLDANKDVRGASADDGFEWEAWYKGKK